MKPGSYVYVAEKDVEKFTEKGFKPISIMQDGKQLYYRPFGWAVEQRYFWEREENGGALRIYDRLLGEGCDYSSSRRVAIAWDVDLVNAICEALNERVTR